MVKTKEEKHYYVYIMASKNNGTIYTGVTNDLIRRVNEHRSDFCDGFTKRYKVHTLVYYAGTNEVNSAIYLEKCVKKWRRNWKIRIIEEKNPDWKDLWEEINQ